MSLALANGRREIDIVKKFEGLFPDSRHFISYYSGTKGDPRWNSKIGLHGRYILTLQFDIQFDPTRTHPERSSEPIYYLVEIDRIESDGHSYTDRQIRFDHAEWQHLLESGGDFGVIGYPMEHSRPLEGFEATWK